MKLLAVRRVVAAAAMLGAVVAGAPARATVIASNAITVATGNGSITVRSTVDDSVGGDASRWLFQYAVSGDYDPMAPDTNGISSLQIVFGGLVADVTDQTGPGWDQNATGTAPPLGAGWDRPNSAGAGIGPNDGEVLFSFAVPAGTGFTPLPQGSYAGSHFFDVPFGLVSLVDAASGQGPIVPVPEPGTLLLIAAGVAALVGQRRADRG